MEKVIAFAHGIIKNKINNNDICVDATIGNGHDTLFLASCCKFVYGFDIQKTAIDNTTDLLEKNNFENYKLILDSHSNMDLYIKEKVKAFIFNFGYLPSGDKNITTMKDSSLMAIQKALELLDDKGIIAMVIYPGHQEGNIESLAINDFVKTLNQKEYDVVYYGFINQINNPPYTIIIEKR